MVWQNGLQFDASGNLLVSSGTGPAKNLIMDSQWITDTDEYRGLRILAWGHTLGIINLLAVTNSVNTTGVTNPDAPQLISQILTTQGVNGVLLSSGPTTTQVTLTSTSVGAFLSQAFTPLRRLRSSLGLNTSVPVLRQALASATSPVDICCQGPGNNLYDLYNSAADSISPLTGAQLIAQKVGTLYWVGGQYPLSTAPVGAEFNFGNIPTFTTTLWPITAFLLANWPTPITFVGFENGPAFSCGAYDSLTATDPLGFAAGVSATFQFGRHGWGTVGALVALQGPAKAGFTTVQGTNAINTTTGFNTFTPGGGSHSYVVPAVSQRAIQQISDAICAPGVTQPTSYVNVAETIYTTPATSAQIDGVNLISWYYAPDIALTNGASVPLWPDRCGRANLVQATVGLQPTYATALISEIAVSFAGTAALATDTPLDLPHNCTIYAYVECNALSTAFMFAATHGISSGSTDLRSLILGRSRTSDSPASSPQGETVIQNTFSSAFSSTPLTLNVWAVMTVVRNGSNILCYMNGVAVGTTPIAVPSNFDALTTAVSNHIVGPLIVGAQYVDGGPTAQAGWNGGIKEIRVYNNAHSAAQVTAVSTAMTT